MVLEVKQLQMDYNMCKCVCIFSAVKAMPQHLQELTTKSTLEGLTYIKKNITDVNEEMILHLKKLHMTPSFGGSISACTRNYTVVLFQHYS